MDKSLLEKAFKMAAEQGKYYIDTGYCELNEFLCHLNRGSLITIGGAVSMGKTTFCRNIIEKQLMKGKKCLYFNLVGTKEQFVSELMFLNANIERIKGLNNALKDEDYQKLSEAMERMSDWQLLVADCSKYKIESITNSIKTLGWEYVFIDTLKELRYKDKYNINHILKEIKDCAVKSQSVIFITDTLTDSVENNPNNFPTWKDFEDSENIIQYSDEILLLYRPDYYFSIEEMPDCHKPNTIEIISTKKIKNTVSYDFDACLGRIKSNNCGR